MNDYSTSIWTIDQWRAERLSSTPQTSKVHKTNPTWQTKRSSLLDQTAVAPKGVHSAQLPVHDAYLRPLPMDSTSPPILMLDLLHAVDVSSSYPKKNSTPTPVALLLEPLA